MECPELVPPFYALAMQVEAAGILPMWSRGSGQHMTKTAVSGPIGSSIEITPTPASAAIRDILRALDHELRVFSALSW